MSDPISNYDGVLDSRDIIARIEHLSALRQPGPVDLGDEDNGTDQDTLFQELAALEALQDEAEGYSPGWQYGATLIRDSHFTTYAQELAEDIGAINPNFAWPTCHIDWEAAADALKMDYTEVKFAGVAYWVR